MPSLWRDFSSRGAQPGDSFHVGQRLDPITWVWCLCRKLRDEPSPQEYLLHAGPCSRGTTVSVTDPNGVMEPSPQKPEQVRQVPDVLVDAKRVEKQALGGWRRCRVAPRVGPRPGRGVFVLSGHCSARFPESSPEPRGEGRFSSITKNLQPRRSHGF